MTVAARSARASGATVFREPPWLFGKRADLLAFGGSAAVSFLLLGLGAAAGVLEQDVPDVIWLGCVLLIDVAHVWSTIYRVYLDPAEVARRRVVYMGLPVLCYGLGVALHAHGALTFWRVAAYLAVFHFVRQQVGWLRLYHRRAPSTPQWERHLDTAIVYASMVYPLIWWHAHLPRRFTWFVDDDFVVGLSADVSAWFAPVYWGLSVTWLGVTLLNMSGVGGRAAHWGKVLLVVTTWACWHVGIMVFDGDFAFTVTNVIIHGVPYLMLTTRYASVRVNEPEARLPRWAGRGAAVLLLVIVAIAFVEETFWDRYVWHDRPHFFGDGADLGAIALTLLTPLLALPQLVHYALDGIVWRRAGNPGLGTRLGL